MSTKTATKPKAIELREGEWDDNGCPVALLIRITPEGTFGRNVGTGGGWRWCAGITGKPGAFGSGREKTDADALRAARRAAITALDAMNRIVTKIEYRPEVRE